MKRSVLLGALLLLSPALQAADLPALKKEGKTAIQALAKELGGRMQRAMQSGGPLAAIGVCNAQALPLTEEVSKRQGLEIGRTSLKLRNPKNAPDAWEKAVLMEFERRAAAGEAPAQLVKAEILTEQGRQIFRMMKAIPTQEQCLKCHGTRIAPEVAQTLDQLYPNDQARGYRPGQIRGAFTLKKRL